jgi:hypothetical protein
VLRRLLCRARGHRPHVPAGDVWRCRCGDRHWRGPHSMIAVPDAELMHGAERLP